MVDNHKLVNSFRYAFAGLFWALRHNQNLRIHFGVAVLVIIASIYFQVNAFEMGILGVMILLVIASEMINASIEEIANLVTREHRQEAKTAKDVAAGMVLVAALGSVIVGILVFAPHVVKLFF